MRSASTPAPAPRSCMRTSASGARSAPSPVRSAPSITSPTPAKCRNATSAAATPPAPAPARPAPSPTSTPTGPGSTRCASGPARPTPNRAPPPKETTMAWTRKFLRVDLTNGTCKAEPLNMQWAQEYLGQRGLATKYFVEEVDPKVDPLSPGNKLIMATGPLTGTPASTGGRYSVITKGALTGAIACSNSGGYFGAELKFAGWDMVIFEGKSAKPVYLVIENDKAELLDAAHLWGQTVFKTEEIIKSSHQDPQIRVSSIGRSGENGVMFACIVNDLHRAAGRSGVGTVMGSKNLKAIAVRGTKGVGNISNPKEFMKVTYEKKKILAENAVTGTGLPTYGTQVL